MEQLKNTTELIGLKDKNIKIKTVFKVDTHITIEASLDYQPPLCPHCKSQMSKYDFQRASTIPILDVQGMPTVLKLKKRRFQCKGCHRVTVSETRKIVTLLENNRQTTIKNYFYRYPRTVREAVKAVTVDMSGAYIPILRPFALLFLGSG